MIQASEDPDFLVHFVHLTFLLCLDGLTSDLAIIDSIECEMDCGKASTTQAMRRDCIFSDRLIPRLEGCSPVHSKTLPFEQPQSGVSVRIYAFSPWLS